MAYKTARCNYIEPRLAARSKFEDTHIANTAAVLSKRSGSDALRWHYACVYRQ